MRFFSLCSLLFLACLPAGAAALDPDLGQITLQNQAGETVAFSSLPKGKFTVLVAAGTSCPVMRKYIPALNGLYEKWQKKGVELYLLGEAKHDTNEKLQAEFRSFSSKLPVYFDKNQSLAKKFDLNVTTKVAVLNGDSGELVYAGAIDDQFGSAGRKNKKSTPFLDQNLQALLDKKSLPHPNTRAFGCAISFR